MDIPTLSAAQLQELLAAEAQSDDTPDTPYSSPFMRLLMSADLSQLARSFTPRACRAGEIVFREDEPGDTLYFIRSGRVAIVKGDLKAPTILAFRRAGDIIGEMSVLDNQPRSASIIALDDLQLLGITRQEFQRLLQETPAVSLSMMEMLSTRLRRSDQARSSGELSEKRLIRQLSDLESEKQRLEELQRLRQETTELIIHDLRNPLSAIAVAIRMLSVMLPPEVLQSNREILNVAQTSCERMQRLVENLLEVSRLEAGESYYNLSGVDLGALIEEVVARAAILEHNDIQIGTRLPLDLPAVQADRDKIERVLTNLLDNALKYTPEGGRIEFAAEVRDGEVWVSLNDNGPGVPPEDRERIFERFSQAAGAPRRRGFGLGLAYCRLAVQGHGGRIWVESGAGGQGSRFIFTLPCNRSPGG